MVTQAITTTTTATVFDFIANEVVMGGFMMVYALHTYHQNVHHRINFFSLWRIDTKWTTVLGLCSQTLFYSTTVLVQLKWYHDNDDGWWYSLQ
jgi:hypothetical protein